MPTQSGGFSVRVPGLTCRDATNEIGISRYRPPAGSRTADRGSTLRMAFPHGARALAAIGDRIRHWHHRATTLAQTHAPAAFDPHSTEPVGRRASARVYHSANIWLGLAPSFGANYFGGRKGKRSYVSALARSEGALMERSDLVDKVLRRSPTREVHNRHTVFDLLSGSNSAWCVRDDEGDAEEGFGRMTSTGRS
jgi:hypothetical protein